LPDSAGSLKGPSVRGEDGQFYRERPAVAPLADLVSATCIQGVSAQADPYINRSIPNGSVEIWCEIGSAPTVCGPLTGPIVRTLGPGSTLVGVRFRPAASGVALGLPASELVDSVIGLGEIWGRAGHEIGERIAEAASAEQAVAVLEAGILRQVADGADVDPAVSQAVQLLQPRDSGGMRMLTSALQISERQLRRRVVAGLGYGPRALHRIWRLQRFLAVAQVPREAGRRNLAVIASDAGYADQAHLARDSSRLTGLTPTVLLENIREQCGPTHHHLPWYLPLLEGIERSTRRP
jgi:AraC-like DNA-binding protein